MQQSSALKCLLCCNRISPVPVSYTAPSLETRLKTLRKQLPLCYGQERFALRRALFALEKQPQDNRLQELEARIAASMQIRALRLQNLPKLDYPTELPVAARREDQHVGR